MHRHSILQAAPRSGQLEWGGRCLSGQIYWLATLKLTKTSHQKGIFIHFNRVFSWNKPSILGFFPLFLETPRWWQLKYFCDFHPEPWGNDFHFDEHIFQMGWNHQLEKGLWEKIIDSKVTLKGNAHRYTTNIAGWKMEPDWVDVFPVIFQPAMLVYRRLPTEKMGGRIPGVLIRVCILK